MAYAGEKELKRLLSLADIEIGGKRPWDIQVHDERVFDRIVKHGSMGLGESYMDGWWDAEAVDQVFEKAIGANLARKVKVSPDLVWGFLSNIFKNMQIPRLSLRVGEEHYDIGNDLYKKMLDKRLVYSCGYWKDAKNLNEAQEAKLDLICRKLGLKPGDTILDIGCGWGSFAKYAAEKYGAIVTGVTISKEQIALGTELCKGLPVTLKFQDYRDVEGQFDYVVSIGMFEHVGWKNYRTFMETVSRCLKDDGLFLLHTIGKKNGATYVNDPWITKYIFTNSSLPSLGQIAKAFKGTFVMEDWHNFGADYDKTLMAWFENFNRAWPELKPEYSERFYRMWKYYLLLCAGAFRARRTQLWQVVLSKKGVKGGYTSVR